MGWELWGWCKPRNTDDISLQQGRLCLGTMWTGKSKMEREREKGSHIAPDIILMPGSSHVYAHSEFPVVWKVFLFLIKAFWVEFLQLKQTAIHPMLRPLCYIRLNAPSNFYSLDQFCTHFPICVFPALNTRLPHTYLYVIGYRKKQALGSGSLAEIPCSVV